MVDAYRADLHRHLTFLQCQTTLSGDVNALRRIWRLLDHWGVINFQVDAASNAGRPSFLVTPGGALQLDPCL